MDTALNRLSDSANPLGAPAWCANSNEKIYNRQKRGYAGCPLLFIIFKNKIIFTLLALASTLPVLALCRSHKLKIRSQIHLLKQTLSLT
tara:strand:- start:53 stop:319 length:267 start_codon:yes stop_codon:yes gene_type:complete